MGTLLPLSVTDELVFGGTVAVFVGARGTGVTFSGHRFLFWTPRVIGVTFKRSIANVFFWRVCGVLGRVDDPYQGTCLLAKVMHDARPYPINRQMPPSDLSSVDRLAIGPSLSFFTTHVAFALATFCFRRLIGR